MKSNMKFEQGFTLIESLLALFVLTIGILGVAGLQMQGMRSSNMALQRTIVVIKTQEIIERMRANSTWDENKRSAADNLTVLQAYAGSPTAGGCNSGSFCDGLTLAAHDLSVWQSELTSMLPTLESANIVVTPPAVAGEPTTVMVTTTWTDRAENGLTYSMSVRI